MINEIEIQVDHIDNIVATRRLSSLYRKPIWLLFFRTANTAECMNYIKNANWEYYEHRIEQSFLFVMLLFFGDKQVRRLLPPIAGPGTNCATAHSIKPGWWFIYLVWSWKGLMCC